MFSEFLTSMFLFQRHVIIHTNERPSFLHKCSFCSRTFRSKSSLVVHERTHTGEKPFKCNICEKPFADRSNFKVHQKSCKRNYELSVSNEEFAIPSHQDHTVNYQNIEKSAEDQSELDIKIVDEFESQTLIQESENANSENIGSAEQILTAATILQTSLLKCRYCNEEFRLLQSLKEHELIHKEDGFLIQDDNGNQESESQIQQPLQTSKNLECKFCGKVLPSSSRLQVSLKAPNSS